MSKTIAIFLAGQNGDILTASSVLRYRNELWGEAKIIWYLENRNRDLLKYQNIELRDFPRGFGYPNLVEIENKSNGNLLWEDWHPLVDENNHMNLELKKNYTSLADIDYGYFPAPHQQSPSQRDGLLYPNISKKVFGVPDDWEWHPVLKVSEEEKEIIMKWFPPYHAIHSKTTPTELVPKKAIAIETYCGSGQSLLNESMIKDTMNMCREIMGECYFIFVSHKFLNKNEVFPEYLIEDKNVYFASDFSVRQCAYIAACCALLVSVSSGISVAASCWQFKDNPTPIIQFCGSEVCSTRAMATGKFELITHDDKDFKVARIEYFLKLMKLLKNE